MAESEALRHPLKAMEFCLAYIGYPFATGISLHRAGIAAIAGGLLTALLGLSLVYLWIGRTDRALRLRAAPWLALVSIALLNCLLNLARSGRLWHLGGNAIALRAVCGSSTYRVTISRCAGN